MKLDKKIMPWTWLAKSSFASTLFFLIASLSLANTQPLAEGNFEVPDLSNGTYQYRPGGTSWTYLTHAGISANNSDFTNFNPSAPEGDQVLFVQLSGLVSKSVQLSAGTYRFSFKAAQRKRLNSTDQQTFSVKLNGQVIGIFTPNNHQYQLLQTETITLNEGMHELSLEGMTLPGNDNTAFIDDIQIITVQAPSLWSDPSTWPNGVPGPNSIVEIDSHQMILLDVNADIKNLRIKGKLIADQSSDLSLSSNWIMVEGENSQLIWGTEENPYTKQGIITLKHEPNDSLDGPGSKFLAARNKALVDIHGQARLSWTQLASTAPSGSTSITLRTVTDWQIGDQIVIASTDFDAHQAEVRTVTGLSNFGQTLHLDAALDFTHYGELHTFTNDNNEVLTLDESAEVGLLNRNIKIQGDANSELDGFGGHTMFMPTSFVRFSGIELYRMGQKKLLARYPFHWHFAQDVTGQYIKNCSIHLSYNRTVTIHGANNALVEDNMSYDHIGHGYYLENGTEVGNVLRHNLGILTKAPLFGEEVTPHDTATLNGKVQLPATFWISNPENDLIDNASAGSEGSGIWILALEENLEGPIMNPPPMNRPLGIFKGNRSHSNSDSNLSIGSSVDRNSGLFFYNKTYRPEDANGNPVEPVIKDFTGFKCEERNIWTRSTTIIVDSSALADCLRNTYFSFNTVLSNSLIVGKSDNIGTLDSLKDFEINVERSLPNPGLPPTNFKNLFSGFSMYNGSNEISNVHFAMFDKDNSAAIMTIPGNHKSPTHLLDGLSFDTTVADSSKVNFSHFSWREGVYSTGIIDLDGSLTGIAGTHITPKINARNGNDEKIRDDLFNRESAATLRSDWNAFLNHTEQFGQLFIFNSWDSGFRFPIYNIRSDDAVTYDDINSKWFKRNPVIVNNNFKYYWQYHRISNQIESQLRFVDQGDNMISVFPNMPSSTYLYNGSFGNSPLTSLASLSALESSLTQAVFFKDNTLYIKHKATIERDPALYGDHKSRASVPIRICQNLNCATPKESTETVTLADFEMGIDGRIKRWGSGMPIPVVTTSGPIDPHDNIDTEISWTITNDNDGNSNDYVQVAIDFPRQVWTEFKSVILNVSGIPQFQFYTRDGANNHQDFGDFNSGSQVVIPLSLASSPTKLDEVNRIIIRLRERHLQGASSATINVFDIQLSTEVPVSSREQETNDQQISLQSKDNQQLHVYPNPAEDYFTLTDTFEKETTLSFRLFDAQGRLLIEQTLEVDAGEWSKDFNISQLQLTSGLYKISLQDDYGGMKTGSLFIH